MVNTYVWKMMVPFALKKAMKIFPSGTVLLIAENVIVYMLKGPKGSRLSETIVVWDITSI